MRTFTRCNRVVSQGRTRLAGSIKLFLMSFLLISFLIPTRISAQINIDGNSSEWSSYTSAHVQDMFGNGVVDDQFTEGSKDFLLASEWIWSLSQTKAKNDIANGAAVIVPTIQVHGTTFNGTGPYLAFAGDRTSNNGDAQIGFWFFQDGTAPVTVNGINNFAPPKHDGDLLVLADFTGGGNDATVTVLSWVSDGSGTYPNSNGHFNLVATGAAVAENNGGTTGIPAGWQFLSGATSYGTNEFYEGFVDLGTFARGAACFSRFQLETRSSQSITASLDDFVGGPLGGVPSVTVNSASRCSDGAGVTITATPTPAGTYTYTWTVPAGATDPGNVASFSATVAGTYSVTITNENGCTSSPGSGVLTVNHTPAPTAHNLTTCENGSTGSASVNLTSAIDNADGGTVSFYTSLANAQSGTSPIATPSSYSVNVGSAVTIYVRSASGDCSGTTSFTVTVTDNPDVTAHNLTSCEDGTSGGANVNLTTAIDNADGGTVSFYTSLANAQAGTSAIATPSSYNVTVAGSPATIYVRSANGSCFGTTSFTVTVTDNPDVTAHNLSSCENGSTGAASFNLSTAIDNADGGTISFYTSLANAQSGTSPIATPSSYSVNVGSPATIYVRSANGSCYGTTSFTVTVTDNPDVATTNITACEDGTTGHATVNLNTGVTDADGGTLSFYTTLANAQSGSSPIANPTTYSASVGTTTIYVRSANGSCFGTGSFTVTVTSSATASAGTATPQCRNASGTNTFGTNTFNLSGSGSGGSPSWSVFANPQGYTVNITNGNTYSPTVALSGSSVNGGSVTMRLTVSGGTCGMATSDVVLTLNALPLVKTLTATNFCPNAATGGSVTLHNSQTGVSYQLQKDGSNYGSPQNGNGSDITWSPVPVGTYTVVGTILATSCNTTSGPADVAENSVPEPTADNKDVCTGSMIALTGSPAGGTWSGAHVTGSTFDATGLAAGPYTVTYTVTNQSGCTASVNATVTVHALPTVTADNKEVCTDATVDLTGSPAGGTWSGAHVTGSTFDATGLAAGNYTVTYTVTDQFGCTNSANATVTVKTCGGPLCTYTQGYYGNKNGNSCDADGSGSGPVTYQNPVDLITAELMNGGTITIGASGRSVILPVPDAFTTAMKINSVMPGNSTPKELSAGDIDINSGTFNSTYLNKQGKINNVLLSQTITLALNMRISTGLPDLALQAGTFATAAPDGPCGTTTPKPQCTYNPVYPFNLMGDSYVYKTISTDVISALNMKGYPLTVTGLLQLANDALANVDGVTGSEGGASLSAINAAIDAINTGFDGCRIFQGWNITPCPSTDPNAIVSSGASRMSGNDLTQLAQSNKLSVSAYPNPFNDVVKFTIQSKVSGQAQLTVYNMLGQRINTVYNGYVQANKSISIEYKAPVDAQQNLIYILAINGEKVTGKVLNVKH